MANSNYVLQVSKDFMGRLSMANYVSKFSIVSLAIVAFGLCACTTPNDPKIDDWSHSQDGSLPIGHGQGGVITPPPAPSLPPPPPPPLSPPQIAGTMPMNSATTYLSGCTGEFFVADFNSGKILSSGRAFNAVDGLYVLNSNGTKTGQVVNAGQGKSVFFRPDCGCVSKGAPMPAPQPNHMCPK